MLAGTLSECQWDADENMVSHIVQDPASLLLYSITVCLEGEKIPSAWSKLPRGLCCDKKYTSLKTVIAFSCKVAAPLSVSL